MAAEQYLDHVVETFYEHLDFMARLEPPCITEDEAAYLQGYFANWVELGTATEVTGGNFGTFMRAVVRIVDDYDKDPTLGGKFEPGLIQGILNAEHTSTWFLDPDFFAAQALQRQLPKVVKYPGVESFIQFRSN